MSTTTWYEDVSKMVTTAPATLSRAPETAGTTLSAVLTEMVTKAATTAPAAATTALSAATTAPAAATTALSAATTAPAAAMTALAAATPAPAAAAPAYVTAEAWTRLPLVTEAVTKGIDLDDGAFAPLIVGISCITLLLVFCIIVVLLWCSSRHKGSYVTKEMDDDHVDDEEFVCSDAALQSWEPLENNEDA